MNPQTAAQFIHLIAQMTRTGDAHADFDEGFRHTADDAILTLDNLIDEARRIAQDTYPVFTLASKDSKHGPDGAWEWVAVLSYTGKLEGHEEHPDWVSDDQITAINHFLSGYCGIHIRSEGSGQPGDRFAAAPHYQFFPGTIIVTQSGGLDV